MAVAAMAKVLRGGRSGSSTSSLIAAMRRRVPQEGVAGAQLLGSALAAHAAGASRLMHSGQWRNSMLSGGNLRKLAEQKALLFGKCGVLPQEHKIMGTGQFSGKRFMSDVPSGSSNDFPVAVCVYAVLSVVLTLPIHFRKLTRYLKE
ncbi:unnamed protein product [Urochloa humidicola]